MTDPPTGGQLDEPLPLPDDEPEEPDDELLLPEELLEEPDDELELPLLDDDEPLDELDDDPEELSLLLDELLSDELEEELLDEELEDDELLEEGSGGSQQPSPSCTTSHLRLSAIHLAQPNVPAGTLSAVAHPHSPLDESWALQMSGQTTPIES